MQHADNAARCATTRDNRLSGTLTLPRLSCAYVRPMGIGGPAADPPAPPDPPKTRIPPLGGACWAPFRARKC